MKKKNFKKLSFSKQDIADLTKEEQHKLLGGNDYTETIYLNTCGCDLTDGCTGCCPSDATNSYDNNCPTMQSGCGCPSIDIQCEPTYDCTREVTLVGC